jgi:hypothetical protein
MVTDFILTHFLDRAWREASLLLSDEERLDLIRRWWPFTGRRWRRGMRSWR